jgi:hypothetical protein
VKKEENIPVVEDNGGSHLQEVGQKVHQKDWGTLTLLNRVKVDKTFTISPMVITLNDIKLIKLSNMKKETKDLLREYTGLSPEETYELYAVEHLSNDEIKDKLDSSRTEIGNDITYFEITYSVKNTGSKDLQFFSMENVTLNDKLTYRVPEKNFILSGDTLIGTKSVSRVDYSPDEEREGTIGLLNESGQNIKKITSLSFSTDDLLDGDSHDLLAKSQTFQLNF